MTKQTAQPQINDRAVEFLTQECDRMLTLYSQEQGNAQSVFNFYLTFVTTILGAVIVLLQLNSGDTLSIRLLLCALLLFTLVVGSVYLSALSGRYARSARYSLAVDEIRRFLIDRLDVAVPGIYDSLAKARTPSPVRWYHWLFPTGTYQMFMGFVNATAAASIIILLANFGTAGFGSAVFAALFVFALTLIISNIYSRLVIRRFGHDVNIHMWSESPAWAARE